MMSLSAAVLGDVTSVVHDRQNWMMYLVAGGKFGKIGLYPKNEKGCVIAVRYLCTV